MILITTTCKNKKEAGKIVRRLLKLRLVACGEMHPVESIYRWKGKIQKAKEVSLFLKTKQGLAKKVSREIEKLHSYDTPVIVTLKPGFVNKKSENWLNKEI